MRTTSLINRFEPWFIVGAATIYVIRRLVEEIYRYNDMIESVQRNKVPLATLWRNLDHYSHTLNNNVPLIAGVCLFLVAWYVFHNLAFPALQEHINDRQGWFYGGAAVVLLLASALVYHYLKLHLRFMENSSGDIIGMKAYSLYRKRTVLADAIGLGIVLGTYELAYQYYQFLYRRIAQETTIHFQLVSYLLLGGISILMLTFAINGYVPQALWNFESGFGDLLLTLGLLIQVIFFQSYVYNYIIPILKKPRLSEVMLANTIGVYLLTIILANTILWGARTYFYYYNVKEMIMVCSVIVLIASVAFAYLRQALTKEKTVLQTQVSVGVAELASLRAQINPHFLFNALNSLYATALKEKGEKTADGIQKLGDMMRFMLQENNRDRIPLDKEVEYLRNYIELQRMRIDESHDIEIRVNIQEPDRAIYLAPMMLTPFVENAFKHGISLRHKSWIYITLTLDDTRLYFKVHNSRHAKPDRHDPEEDQSGVGLDNVRKRLDLIYPGRHQLDIQQSDQDYFVSLTLVYW
ncbi:sensor histidine kinase [Fibrella forsythiae]|uniref:Histidine kinase n=1 Tax=Fibrella forsythiae TaxID=2817061 RepID=A0ABS3JEF4_9BACT|nr:histidine kinase [Fibrella forsythiae]MBO0948385.1 histidine kinase [Fibrella forsythiae]